MTGMLTAAEYAAKYGMHPGSVRRACGAGRLNAVKTSANGCWRIADESPEAMREDAERIAEDKRMIAACLAEIGEGLTALGEEAVANARKVLAS